MTPRRVCFVCTGNICRSPMAEVVLRTLAERAGGPELVVSSAGTGDWHVGSSMDPRAAAALVAAGYPDHPHVARQMDRTSLEHQDLVVALDRRHLEALRALGAAPGDHLALLRSFDPEARGSLDVPDPYYGQPADFTACLALVEAGCRGLLEHLAAP